MDRYLEHKSSGVLWIGNIPAHWEIKQLRSFLTLFSEKGHGDAQLLSVTREQGVIERNKDNKEENHNFVPDDLSGYKYIEKGDFAINKMKAWQGSYAVSDYNGIVSPAYFTCKLHGVNKDFFSRAIRSKAYVPFFTQYSKGIRVDQWDLNPNALKTIPFFLPPLSEQEQIVSYLDDKTSKIDTYIAEKEKELNLYKQLIEANIYSKNSNDVVTFTSWESFFDNSWNTRTGKGLFEEVDIKGINSERFLAVTQDKGLIYKDEEGVNFVTAEKKETQKLVCPGQFVISLRSFEGGIEYSTLKGLVSPAYVILKLKKEYDTEELQMYFKFLFKSEPFVSRLNSISDSMRDGKSIKFADIKRFPFPIPSDEKLKHIFKLSRIYDVKKDALCKEKILINQYKQRLISDSVTGQIIVQNI